MINNKCKLNNNTLTHKEQLYHFKTFHHCETRNQPAWVSTGSWLLTAWLLTQNYTFISLLSQKWNESVLPSAIQNIKKVGILPIRIVTSNVLSVRPFVREKKQLQPEFDHHTLIVFVPRGQSLRSPCTACMVGIWDNHHWSISIG